MSNTPAPDLPPADAPASSPRTGTARSDRIAVAAGMIAVVGVVFGLFFVMGFVSVWLQSAGDLPALVMRGLKLGASGSVGVTCIGIAAKSWQRVAVPAWIPPTAAMAVGFFVMNGLGEFFDGRHATILSKAGSGFLIGSFAGLGIYWAQQQGWVKRSAFVAWSRTNADQPQRNKEVDHEQVGNVEVAAPSKGGCISETRKNQPDA